MKIGLGEIVTIRSDLIPDQIYGSEYFVDTMLEYLGAHAMIKQIDRNGTSCKLDVDDMRYFWSAAMFED